MLLQADERMHTRLAPTPSGYLHIGNACSFLLTAHLANQNSGSILLRIDDMDQERVRLEYVHDIFEALDFLHIEWQHGPKNISEFQQHFSQHLRLQRYEEVLDKLLQTGLVYACVCSRKQLEANSRNCECRLLQLPLDTTEVSWRIQVPGGTVISFTDERMGLQHIDLHQQMPDFVVRKKDRLPAYQVCSLADDVHFGINYIVRGEDLLYSTAAQLYLASIINEESFLQTRFFHHPLLTNQEGIKLSKSAGASSLKVLRQQGLRKDNLLQIVQRWLM